MIRGINRSIIEINETENMYFEKVIVFVRPEYGKVSQSQLKKAAAKMVSNMSAPAVGLKKRSSARKRAAVKRRRTILTCAAVIALVAIAIILSL